MVNSELLREASALMRHNASIATPGTWKLWGMLVMADQDGTSNVDTAVEVAHTLHRDEDNKPRTWDAKHIAGMQPSVALAVAEWLRTEAIAWDHDYDSHETRHLYAYGRTPSDEWSDHCAVIATEYADGQHRHALDVARAYFGGLVS